MLIRIIYSHKNTILNICCTPMVNFVCRTQE